MKLKCVIEETHSYQSTWNGWTLAIQVWRRESSLVHIGVRDCPLAVGSGQASITVSLVEPQLIILDDWLALAKRGSVLVRSGELIVVS